LEITILGSPEYLSLRDTGTNEEFVSALYFDVLNRTSFSDPGAQGWTNALNNHLLTRSQVAAAVVLSQENLQNLVQGYYRQFLARSAGPSELAAWVSVLQSGISQTEVLAAILGSQESFADPVF
jgi:hypothetical protein